MERARSALLKAKALLAGPAAWVRARERYFRVLPTVILVFVIAWMYEPSLAAHIKNSRDPSFINDDARVQIYPFMRAHDSTLFNHDYIADYSLACMGWGYRIFYWALSHVFDPKSISKALPYVLLAIIATALGIAAYKWGKTAGAWFAVALCLSTDVYFDRMGGGLPRSFGFPIVACAVAALVHGRVRILAAIVVIGAAFYPAAAMPGGMALAALLLLMPARDRGEAETWPLKKRFITVAGTALLAGIVLLPTSLSLRPYGAYITPKDVAAYPEAGPGGRFYKGDRPPYPTLGEDISADAPRTLAGAGEAWSQFVDKNVISKETREGMVLFILGFAAIGFLRLAVRDTAARRLLAFIMAASLGHWVADKIAPWFYLPHRYVVFPAPIVVTLMVVAAAACFLDGAVSWGDRPWVKATSVVLLGIITLYYVGGRGSDRSGLTIRVDQRSRLYAYVRTLPKDVMIAGFPAGEMDNIPYATDRQAFDTFETHVAFNKGFADTMRTRLNALFAAYYGSGPEPLKKLRDELGVTHLLVDSRNFGDKPPSYFAPFNPVITAAFNAGKKDGFYVQKLAATAAFHEGSVTVIDLTTVN